MIKTFFFLLSFFLLSNLAFADAVLIDFKGEVTAKLKRLKLPLGIGTTLPHDSTLTVGKKSSATLMYMNNEIVVLKENEKISIGKKINKNQVKKTVIIPGLIGAIEEVKAIRGEAGPTVQGTVKMGRPQSGMPQSMVLGGALFGVEGLFPTHSRILPEKKMIFEWRLEEKTKIDRPYFVLENEKQKVFYIRALAKKQNQFVLALPLQRLERGRKYCWHLAEKKGKDIQIKGARYWFQFLTKTEEKHLQEKLKQIQSLELSVDATALLEAQVYYQFDLFHAMVESLEPVMKKSPNALARQLLFLAHLRMGHSQQVEKYRE